MFTIGDFASLGRVSVRMLRHYDAVGLLRPARVGPFTGYRHYRADQLTRLNRIIALKDLGFTLAQVQQILTEQVDAAQLHEENGYRPSGAGYAREVYLDYDPHAPENGVTELQIPVTRA